jgi:trigger factor
VKVTTETLPERQVKLQIEIDDDQQKKAMEQAYKKLAPRVRIRGFRPGKAPRAMIEKEIGHHRLLDEAMDIILPDAYKEALEQEALTPVAQPTVELVSHEPMIFSATVPLQPSIELNDYKAIRVPREQATIDEAEVEKSITDLRRRYGTLEPVDRPAQKGDIITGSIKATAEGDVNLVNQEEIEYRLADETLASLPGLLDIIVGMKKGEEVEKTITAPEDFADERLRGQPIVYNVSVSEIKEENLADEDDAFAKQVGEDIESVAALRERVREDIQKAADDEKLREYEAKILDALTDLATVEFAPVMVDHEVEHILEEQANLDPRDPRAVEMYIARMGKSEEEVKESVRPDAELRLKRSLVLSNFAELEGIEVSEEDVQAEIETMASTAGEQADLIRTIFNGEQGRQNIERQLLTRKTFGRLVEIAEGDGAVAAPAAKKTARAAKAAATEATEAAEPAAEAEAKPSKARRSSPRKAE